MTEKSFISKDFLTSNLRLDSEVMSISSLDSQSNTFAITVVVMLLGYTDLVQGLADRGDISANIISRGVESSIVMCKFWFDYRYEKDILS